MLTLKEQDYEDLERIHQSLYTGDWETATQKASKMLEDFLHRIYQYLASTVLPEEFALRLQPGREILEKRKIEFSPEKMTLGNITILFKESDLFTFYGKKANCDTKDLQSINWKKIVELRNLVSHGGKEKIKPADAYFVVDTLHLFLRTVTDWTPRKPKDWSSIFISSKIRIRYILLGVFALFVLIPLALYLINQPKISQTNAMLAGHGQEIAEILEKRGAYDLALWTLGGDPIAIGRDVIRYRLLKLQAQKVKDYDPVQAYLLYEEALNLPVRGDKEAIAQIQQDLLNKMRPYDKAILTIKTLPKGVILIFVFGVIGAISIIGRYARARSK